MCITYVSGWSSTVGMTVYFGFLHWLIRRLNEIDVLGAVRLNKGRQWRKEEETGNQKNTLGLSRSSILSLW